MSKPPGSATEAHDALQQWWKEAGVDAPPSLAPPHKASRKTAKQSRSMPSVAPRPAQKPAAPPADTAQRIAAARIAAAAAGTLEELRTALEAFDAGPVKKRALHTVFARGAAGAPLMVIGEAPGREEDENGLPFVGQSGRLLDRALAAAGLGPKGVYITNAFNWRPPQNRKPAPDELAMTWPFLERHAALADPKVILLTGASAMQAVLGIKGGITRARGHWHDYAVKNPDGSPSGRTIPVLPTFHPAYLLRAPLGKRAFWHDLQSAREKLAQTS